MKNNKLVLKSLSSLAKVFPEVEPKSEHIFSELSGYIGETVSFQLAYYYDDLITRFATISIESELEKAITLREVRLVPVQYPCHLNADDQYIKKTPGLYPDLLSEIKEDKFKLVRGQWRSLWVDVKLTKDCIEGKHPIKLKFTMEPLESEEVWEPVIVEKVIEVISYELPKLSIPHTEWFHGDCIADFYEVDVFSEIHWTYLERFIQSATARDCNMLLTPIFTPPLDTAKGGERTTIQLIDVSIEAQKYHFDFSKFRRWVKMAQKAGIIYFEMSHLFTQWGAIAAPKIMGKVKGVEKQIFGWDTPATSVSYKGFLACFLPELIEVIKDLDIVDVTYFHISDEPTLEQVDSYKEALKIVEPYLKDFQIMDALSNYEFYKNGLVKQPVCATNHIDDFLEHKVEKLWSYYCTAQGVDVSNRFMALPSSRNRIYGMQIYKYDISGILHWGYNFYNSQDSLECINPYEITDCGCAYPSGDAFLVYPGKDGHPEESIRMMVHYEALTDYRAFKWLESLIGKEGVMDIIKSEAITFSSYPIEESFCLEQRFKVNEAIKQILSKRKAKEFL